MPKYVSSETNVLSYYIWEYKSGIISIILKFDLVFHGLMTIYGNVEYIKPDSSCVVTWLPGYISVCWSIAEPEISKVWKLTIFLMLSIWLISEGEGGSENGRQEVENWAIFSLLHRMIRDTYTSLVICFSSGSCQIRLIVGFKTQFYLRQANAHVFVSEDRLHYSKTKFATSRISVTHQCF